MIYTASSSASASPVQPLLGITYKILSALAFTLMAAGIQTVSARYPTGQLVFFRSAFAVLPLLIWLAWNRDLIGAIRTKNIRGHALRSIIGCCGMFSGFVALSYLPLSDAVAIGYAAPLITVVLAAFILKEVVRAYRWSAVVIGLVGVLVMLSPHFWAPAVARVSGSGPMIGAMFGLLGACCAAGATIQVRRLTQSEQTGAIVFYFSVFSALIGLATLVMGWKMPDLADFGMLFMIGVLGGIGQILLTQSFRYADASLIAPFEYTTMVWAFLLGWFFFGQAPQATVVAGAGIVALAGIFVLWREHKLGLIRVKAVEAGAQRTA